MARGNPGNGKVLDPSTRLRPGRTGAGESLSTNLSLFPRAEGIERSEGTLTPVGKACVKKKRTEKDARHDVFHKLIFRCFTFLNKGKEPPWDGSDAKQLAYLLAATPKLDEGEFHRWLINYAKSDNINPAARPRVFLPNISNYASGALDKFGKPKVRIERRINDESPREKLRRQLNGQEKRTSL